MKKESRHHKLATNVNFSLDLCKLREEFLNIHPIFDSLIKGRSIRNYENRVFEIKVVEKFSKRD